jgi:hypothetical protein
MNKQDFFSSICGLEVPINIEGLQMVARSLTVLEMKQIHNRYANDEVNSALMTIVYGLVDPKLDESDLEQLQNAKPGLVMKIAQRITELSGLTESADSPTVGNG